MRVGALERTLQYVLVVENMLARPQAHNYKFLPDGRRCRRDCSNQDTNEESRHDNVYTRSLKKVEQSHPFLQRQNSKKTQMFEKCVRRKQGSAAD